MAEPVADLSIANLEAALAGRRACIKALPDEAFAASVRVSGGIPAQARAFGPCPGRRQPRQRLDRSPQSTSLATAASSPATTDQGGPGAECADLGLPSLGPR